ncbi:MAG: 3-deoxy-manno-octulosonate cytidylyltransferase [Candidatus Cloacimonetes bacterium]|nr:3-deoxy-manno-octulosonate cytidylyltransferase [Candidatus Cloacimonadota bacterium]
MRTIAVIPARYASTRLPGKPLSLIAGKTMIRRVYEAVQGTGLFMKVIVATDDDRIIQEVLSFGGDCVMTSVNCQSGTDRIAEAVKDIDFDLVVNVQGDEPFITREPLELLLNAFEDKNVETASLMTPIVIKEDIYNPNCVKVVCDKNRDAIYFSRASIPFNRDGSGYVTYMRHIGVYAFRREMLFKYVGLEQTPLELCEKLEQLRLIENGYSIRMIETDYQGMGIDTPEDLKKANEYGFFVD